MKSHAAIGYFGVLYISIVVFWFAIGGEIIPEQFVQFESFTCDYAAVCATSKPVMAVAARSKIHCTVECQNHRESCVGVNYLGLNKTCEIFTANPTDFTQSVTGCQYIQIKSQNNVLCYEFGFQSTALVTSLPGPSSGAMASALLNDQLFVARYNVTQVSVYNKSSLQLMRQITFPGLGRSLYGLATSSIHNCLYISDNVNSKVHSVDLSVAHTASVTSWSVPSNPNGVSVTSTGNVLVVTGSTIGEYTPGGSIVRSVTDSNEIWHAVEVKNGVWAFTRKGSSVHGIALISTNGTLVKSFGSTLGSGITQMNSPRGLAIDTNGYILVADHDNDRILVVDPSLTTARQLTLPANTALQRPITVTLEQSEGRLFLGEDGARRALVLDSM